jgi:hypothetical protein
MGGPPIVDRLSPAMQRACLEAVFHGAGMQMTRPSRTRPTVAFVVAVWLFVSLSVRLSVCQSLSLVVACGTGGLQLRHYQAGDARRQSCTTDWETRAGAGAGAGAVQSCGEAGWAGWSRHLPCGLCLAACALCLVPWAMAGQSWILDRQSGRVPPRKSLDPCLSTCASPQHLRRWAARSLQPIICHPAHPPSAKVTSEARWSWRWCCWWWGLGIGAGMRRWTGTGTDWHWYLAFPLLLLLLLVPIPCRWPELGCLSSARLVSSLSLAFPFAFVSSFLSPALVLMPSWSLALLSL